MRRQSRCAAGRAQAERARKVGRRPPLPPLLFDSDLLPDRGFTLEDYQDAHGQTRQRLVRQGGDFWDEATWRAIEDHFGAASPDMELREEVRQAVFHYLAYVPREPVALKRVRRDLAAIEKAARHLRAVLRRLPTSTERDRNARERARGALFTGLSLLGGRLGSHHARSAADFMPPPTWRGTASAWKRRVREADQAVEAMLEDHPDPQLLALAAAWYAADGGNPFLDKLDSLLAILPEVAAAAQGALPTAERRGPKVQHPTLDRLAWKLRDLLRCRCGSGAGVVKWDYERNGYTGDLYELVALIAPRLPPGSLPMTDREQGLGKQLQRALTRGSRTQFN